MKSFTDCLKSKGYAFSSINSMERTIKQFNKWLEKENIEAEQVANRDILAFMKHCQKQGIGQKTIKHYLGDIKHYYDHLIEGKAIATNPMIGIKVQGIKRKVLYHTFQPHELHHIYNSFKDESLKGRRGKVILGLLVYQGLRTEELGRLETNHIKLREGQIDVPGGVRRNGRLLNLEPHQVMEMYDYILQVRPEILKLSNQETGLLFVSPNGGNEISNFMSRMMTRLKKRNQQLVNAQQIRASVITKWLRAHNLREVQYLAGHRVISSTESFMENEMEGLSEEVNQFHPLG